jgi:hypothetical protein
MLADHDERLPSGVSCLAIDAAVDERQHGWVPVVALKEIATAFGMPAWQLLDEPAIENEPD